MKANQYRNSRSIPLCGGINPKGGFVAWPDKKVNWNEEKARCELKRKRARKGFVAWPDKEKAN